MKLELLQVHQLQEALTFFTGFPVKGLVDLKLDRMGDLWGPYRLQGDEFLTYTLRDQAADEIKAMASFVFKSAQIDGRTTRVAWARDLRVSPSRAAILNWAHHFVPVMEDLAQKKSVEAFFSVINLLDLGALNAFIRPRPLRRPLPRYFLYRKFNLVSLHGRFPWAPGPLTSIRLERGSQQNSDALLNYIFQRSSYRPFSEVHDEASFQIKCARLGIQLEDFIIAFESKGRVLGCLAPWSSQRFDCLIPLSYSLRAHNFRQFLKFCWLLGWTRRLTKPVRSTGVEAPLNYKHLSFVFAENEDVFESLLWAAYESCENEEFLVYTHAENDFRLRPPLSWVSASQPHALYSVVPPGQPVPDFLNPGEVRNPEIESYLL